MKPNENMIQFLAKYYCKSGSQISYSLGPLQVKVRPILKIQIYPNPLREISSLYSNKTKPSELSSSEFHSIFDKYIRFNQISFQNLILKPSFKYLLYPIYQPLRSGRIRHKVNF